MHSNNGSGMGTDATALHLNCYRAFHSADQVQDHNALLKSMHIQRVKSSCLRVESNLGSPIALSATATEHDYIGLDCQLSVRRLLSKMHVREIP